MAVCFDAPVVELLETRAEALHPPWPAWGRTCCRRPSMPTRRSDRLRDPARATRTRSREALLDQRALAGIGNVYKSEVLWIERVSPFTATADVERRDPRATGRDRAAPAPRERRDRRTVRNAPRRPATAAAPGPLYVYGRAGRPCRRCRTPIAACQAGHATCPDSPSGVRPASRGPRIIAPDV